MNEMPAPTLNELWRRYLLDVIPADAPEHQVHQAREGFYFGAFSLLVQLDKIGANGIQNGDPAPLLATLMQWSAEGKAYAESVKNKNQGGGDGKAA